MGIMGLVNIQMAIKDNELYVLEANPRASRTVPFVSKGIGIPVAKLAAKVLIGRSLPELLEPYWPYPVRPAWSPDVAGDPPLMQCVTPSNILPTPWPVFPAVKEVVLPFGRFPGSDVLLGPEMRSTGEVMSFGDSFPEAFAKAQIAAGNPLPTEGAVLASLSDRDKRDGIQLVAQLHDWGFEIIATGGTARFLRAMDIPCEEVLKVGEGRPNVVDLIAQGRIDLIINTPSAEEKKSHPAGPPLPSGAVERGLPLPTDTLRTVGYRIRTAALDYHVPYVTTLVALRATVAGIRSLRSGRLPVRTLDDVTARTQE